MQTRRKDVVAGRNRRSNINQPLTPENAMITLYLLMMLQETDGRVQTWHMSWYNSESDCEVMLVSHEKKFRDNKSNQGRVRGFCVKTLAAEEKNEPVFTVNP